MKAIRVTPETFPKIEHELPPLVIDTIRQLYATITDHDGEEMYVVHGVHVGCWDAIKRDVFYSNYALMTSNGEDWSNFPDDWFEVAFFSREHVSLTKEEIEEYIKKKLEGG